MLILGLRSSKKRSLLDVNEHFESERNDKVALLDSFFYVIKFGDERMFVALASTSQAI